ncbi:hypothetical protein ACFL10_00975 [Patescibacteria group bacterium]
MNPTQNPETTQRRVPETQLSKEQIREIIQSIFSGAIMTSEGPKDPLGKTLYLKKELRNLLGVEVGETVEIFGRPFEVKKGRKYQEGGKPQNVVEHSELLYVQAFLTAKLMPEDVSNLHMDGLIHAGNFRASNGSEMQPRSNKLYATERLRKMLGVDVGGVGPNGLIVETGRRNPHLNEFTNVVTEDNKAPVLNAINQSIDAEKNNILNIQAEVQERVSDTTQG